MTFDLNDVGLPKWPALVVVGEPVTVDQAAEILVRTDHWSISTNDREWERLVRQTAGLPPDRMNVKMEELRELWAAEDRFRQSIGKLNLEYLSNSQIASCYIGGPHGWCDWAGRIGCSSYNIGKWPDTASVFEEWRIIAEAFPYLRLWSQLYDGEQCEDDVVPVIEYVVADGEVIAQAPTHREVEPTDTSLSDTMGLLDRKAHV